MGPNSMSLVTGLKSTMALLISLSEVRSQLQELKFDPCGNHGYRLPQFSLDSLRQHLSIPGSCLRNLYPHDAKSTCKAL